MCSVVSDTCVDLNFNSICDQDAALEDESMGQRRSVKQCPGDFQRCCACELLSNVHWPMYETSPERAQFKHQQCNGEKD